MCVCVCVSFSSVTGFTRFVNYYKLLLLGITGSYSSSVFLGRYGRLTLRYINLQVIERELVTVEHFAEVARTRES